MSTEIDYDMLAEKVADKFAQIINSRVSASFDGLLALDSMALESAMDQWFARRSNHVTNTVCNSFEFQRHFKQKLKQTISSINEY